MPTRKEVGKRLAALRGGQSQRTVARLLGISKSALGFYETGERSPRDEVKARIAAFYGKTVQEIFFD